MKAMSDRIREERLRKKLSQEELGNLVGIQKSGIAKYESGRVQQISTDRLEALANALGVTKSYLAGTLEQELLALDYKITENNDGGVSVSDYPDYVHSVSYTASEWRILEMEDVEGFRAISDALNAVKNEKSLGVSTEGLSAIKQSLINKIADMDDETVEALNRIADQVLSLRGK